MNQRHRAILALTTAAIATASLAACSSDQTEDTASSAASTPADGTSTQAAATDNGAITLTNCGQEVTYDKHDRLMVNDGNIIASALAAGAKDKIVAVSSINRDMDILEAKFGDEVADLKQVSKEYPSLEEIISQKPDVYVAGWGYGFGEAENITPESLKDKGIGSYFLTESCKQEDGKARGVEDPWKSVTDDLHNLGVLAGNEDAAAAAIKDQDERLAHLGTLEMAETKPVAFLFDSGSDTIFTSGRFGAPQAIIEAAGATNATADVEDTWTKVGWEKLASADPDVIVFVDYPGQSLEEKIAVLESNPVSKNLKAVKEHRYINLPYAMWTPGPLSIDAAEHMRKALEHFGLEPESKLSPQLSLPESLPGQQYFS